MAGKVGLQKTKVVLPTTPRWTRVIGVDRNKVTTARRADKKVDLPRIKDDLPTTPRWIRPIEVDRNKVTTAHKADKKVDLKKIRVDQAKANLQWTARWQMIPDHTRCPPKKNRTGENPKVEENRKIRLPILQYNLPLIRRTGENRPSKTMVLHADLQARKKRNSFSLNLRKTFKSPGLKRTVVKAILKDPVKLIK